MFSPLHTLVLSDLSRPTLHAPLSKQRQSQSMWSWSPPHDKIIHCLCSVFSRCISNFYFLCSLWTICNAASTHRVSVSCSLITHHCRAYRLPPSWPQPARFLITLMSNTCKGIISLKCFLLVKSKKKKKAVWQERKMYLRTDIYIKYLWKFEVLEEENSKATA